MSKKITHRSICETVLLFIVVIFGYQTNAFANNDSRNGAECGARAMIIEYSIEAYYGQHSDVKFRSQNVAVDYIYKKMANQNLKEKESRVLIARTVKYVYEVLRPQDFSPNFISNINDTYYKNCVFDPENWINNFYIIDWKKANSANTDGEVIYQNKDESITTCSKGKCKTEPPPPPQIGVYDDIRKKVINLGWAPAPSTLKAILIKSKKIDANGFKYHVNEEYGNCLTKSSLCDKTKPELADCEANRCSAVWTNKEGETIYYLIEDGRAVQYNSVPKGWLNR